jgi:hypothetical protein
MYYRDLHTEPYVYGVLPEYRVRNRWVLEPDTRQLHRVQLKGPQIDRDLKT